MSEHKYYFGRIFVRTGEYEFDKPFIFQTIKPPHVYCDELASEYYSGEPDPYGQYNEQEVPEGYYFHAGCVYVEIDWLKELTLGEFLALKPFLTEI